MDRTRGSRRLLVAGLALVVAGVAILGWLGWQLWGTTWVSHRRQADITSDLEKKWAAGEKVARVDEGVATALVRIPAFGEDYRVPLLEGTSDDVLAAGFGHVEDTAEPGQEGNVVIAGHRITHGEPLRDMPELEPGDEVIVETAEQVYTYVLDTGGDDLTVDFDADWVLDPAPVNPDGGVQPPTGGEPGQRLLTLVTCAELFHTEDRLVAFGHLVDTRPR